MTFEEAFHAVKMDYAIYRNNWNAPGQFVMMQVPDKHSKMSVPYLYLKNAQGKNVPWVPSTGDLFADDWIIQVHP